MSLLSIDPGAVVAKLIASRLDAVVPSEIAVIEFEGIVGTYSAGSFWGGTSVASLFRRDDVDASVEELLLLVMSSVQDEVAEALRAPWPFRGDGNEPLAHPIVWRVDNEIHSAFKSAENTLSLKALRTSDLALP